MNNESPSAQTKFKRLLFTNVNKYQQQVLLPCLVLGLLFCCGVFYAMYYIAYIDSNVAILCNIDTAVLTRDVPWFIQMHSFNKVVPWIFFGLTIIVLVIIVWMFFVSNKLLGPSIRVLKELDDILSGERKDPIGTRPGDELFQELVKRINALIQKVK